MLKKVGYVKVKDWASVFRHEELNLFLVVYVDDFKMSGEEYRRRMDADLKGHQNGGTKAAHEVAERQRFNLACNARTCGCVPIILYRPRCNILKEGEVEGIATTHGFDCRSVCACQCGLKRHGVVFRCFSSKSFNSCWSTCKMRGGDTLSQHDRSLAVGKWLNNFAAA